MNTAPLAVLCLFLIVSLTTTTVNCEPTNQNNIFSSILSAFGRKKTSTTTTTPSPFGAKSSPVARCSVQLSQCSAYECCNADQTCLRNRCFPRLRNCPVTRDQCGNSCCKTSEQCRNGQCVR